MVKGVKLVMCIAHDQDMCHVLSGKFGAKAATRVAAKLFFFKDQGRFIILCQYLRVVDVQLENKYIYMRVREIKTC